MLTKIINITNKVVFPALERWDPMRMSLSPSHSRMEEAGCCGQGIDWRTLIVRARPDILLAIEEILQSPEAADYSSKEQFAVRLCLEEALLNAIKHGHQDDSSKAVRLRYHFAPEYLLLEIEDQGPGFNLQDVPDPFALENRERPCGRGLLLMQSYMSWVQFNETGNCVTMCRRRLHA